MPTINQIIRKGRKSKTTKRKSPALNIGYNSKDKKQTSLNAPQKRGILVLDADEFPVGQAFDFEKGRQLFIN